MFSKQEATQLRKEFWTVLGKYLHPVPSASGELCNWINYKTGVKFIRFHMQADEIRTTIAIELDHKDAESRNIALQKFKLLQNELNELPGEWKWQKDETQEMDVYISQLASMHILRKSDWPVMISFFKMAITALDKFWFNNSEIFES